MTKNYNFQVEQVQICLLLFLFRQGAQDIVNYYGQTVVSLIDNADVKKFFQVWGIGSESTKEIFR